MARPKFSRRDVVAFGSTGLAAALLSARAEGAPLPGPSPQDVGSVAGGRVTLPDDGAPTDPAETRPPNPSPPNDRVGFAVVGLGRLSLENILPAFRKVPLKDQFALELDHMATCVAENVEPHTPGEEGRADVRIMQAIYRSADTREAVSLSASAKIDATRGPGPRDS